MFNIFKKLNLGSKIGVVLPSGVLTRLQYEQINQGLKHLGFEPVWAKNAQAKYGYLAGEDCLRAEAFMELWKDLSISLIWCARGGYGACRILDRLDFDFMKKNPKILIGMSDITALHCAFAKKVDYPTFLGPNLSLLFGKKDQVTWHMQTDTLNYLSTFEKSCQIHSCEWIAQGKANAPLMGGNLSVLTSLIGTAWLPTLKDKILLIEEVNEAPYRIDRMLYQLEHCGVLSSLKGVILASFENCTPSLNQESLDLKHIFTHYFKSKNYPVLLGFPSGHINYQKTIPLGVNLQMNSEDGCLFLN
jgi:muramoyltetrapeptide carboxypeptidase